ncbi:hypothetical protein PRZ48_010458 [Zasmidium cellare]|uniref:Major royal jelly protein n=1 Tax=Zasmidium cellare TaxID=395010 RepID=A0ABR0E917_ZASCE|nr:hypothetical protein PRZ48_010458 [Zasmidium cellare]
MRQAQILSTLLACVAAQSEPNWEKQGEIFYDTVKYGPEIELVHLYYDEFPTGIAVSREGRKFSNYPAGLDMNNTNSGSNGKYGIAELIGNKSERAWPSAEMNNPPGGSINYTTYPPSGANYQQYILAPQSIVVDSLNRAWILDTGRSLTPNGTLVPSTYGGPKLIGIDLTKNDTITHTILFPPTVAYPDSYLNDVRLDLRPNITASGKGLAYITDSSVEGRNGIIIADLGTGKSWRHLDGSPTVHPQQQNLPYLWGIPLYGFQPGAPWSHIPFGSDGIALSADSNTLFWKAVGGRYMYSLSTSYLRSTAPNSDLLAQQNVHSLGQSGITDGMETDSNGLIYYGNMEQNSIGVYNPKNGTHGIFVRDRRLNWLDTFSVGWDGYLYFTNNQLVFGAATVPGRDRRRRPFSLWRVKLPDGGRKTGLGSNGNSTGAY